MRCRGPRKARPGLLLLASRLFHDAPGGGRLSPVRGSPTPSKRTSAPFRRAFTLGRSAASFFFSSGCARIIRADRNSSVSGSSASEEYDTAMDGHSHPRTRRSTWRETCSATRTLELFDFLAHYFLFVFSTKTVHFPFPFFATKSSIIQICIEEKYIQVFCGEERHILYLSREKSAFRYYRRIAVFPR